MKQISELVGCLRPELLPKSSGQQWNYLLHLDGFIAFLTSLDFHTYPQEHISHFLEHLNDPLKADLELFCLGKDVEQSRLNPQLKKFLKTLEPSGLIRQENNNSFTMYPYSIYVVDGLIYVADIPNAMMNVYFGLDSLALSRRCHVEYLPGTKFLDLCGGPGVQGLLAAKAGAYVESVEINPIASNVSLLNATLNNLKQRYSIHEMSLHSFSSQLQHTKYQRIVANPPLVPIPDEFTYNRPGHGGVDGLQVTKSILEFAPKLIADHGTCTLIGMCGGNEDGPAILDLLDLLSVDPQLQVILCVLSEVDALNNSNWLNYLTTSLTCYGHKNLDKKAIAEIYQQHNVSKYSPTLSILHEALKEALTVTHHK